MCKLVTSVSRTAIDVKNVFTFFYFGHVFKGRLTYINRRLSSCRRIGSSRNGRSSCRFASSEVQTVPPPLRRTARPQSDDGRDGDPIALRLSVLSSPTYVGAAASQRQACGSRPRSEIRRGYPLNLSILISRGGETNRDSHSNGTRKAQHQIARRPSPQLSSASLPTNPATS